MSKCNTSCPKIFLPLFMVVSILLFYTSGLLYLQAYVIQDLRDQLGPDYKNEKLVDPVIELGPVTWEGKTEDLE